MSLNEQAEKILEGFIMSFNAGSKSVDENSLLFGSARDEVVEQAHVHIMEARDQLELIFRLLMERDSRSIERQFLLVLKRLAESLFHLLYHTGRARKSEVLFG